MNRNKENTLTLNEVAVLLIGIMFGINVAMLPNNLVGIAKQDAWISAAMGGIYPLYVIFIAIYLSKKKPKNNIFEISVEYFGKYLGNMLNILFLVSILTYLPSSVSQITIVTKTYASTFVANLKIYVVILGVGAYCACKGLKTIRRMCSINFYILIIIIIVSLGIVTQGSFLNLKPVLNTGFKDILKASYYSMYDYSCIEIIFLLYPFINDVSKVKNAGLKAVAFVSFTYTYIVFISIYYLGIDIIPKTYWAFFSVTEEIKFMNIANFRFLFLFFLIFIALKSISILYYFLLVALENIVEVKRKYILMFAISAVLIYICNKYYSNLLNREKVLKLTVPLSIIYNLSYISIIALLIYIKKDGKNEKG